LYDLWFSQECENEREREREKRDSKNIESPINKNERENELGDKSWSKTKDSETHEGGERREKKHTKWHVTPQ
jgi:hypothetical protein